MQKGIQMSKNEKTIINNKQEIATLGGGCFWCLEAIFDDLKGVLEIVSGYTGGETPNPTYQQVCTGMTGHAEVVQITFNPQVISFENLLTVFFSLHDPTTLNRQGADVGTQYRSAIYYHNEKQETTAKQVISNLEASKAFNGPIVTELTAFELFYPAEDYHQEYFTQNGQQPYCRAVIAPKVAKFRKVFADELKR
jgi:peptide-methionine (S)-S-oxide reductase